MVAVPNLSRASGRSAGRAVGAPQVPSCAVEAQALPQFQVLGINTNLGFLARLASSPEFIAADFDTGFIASHHDKLFAHDDLSFTQALVLASAAMLPAFDDREESDIGCSPWDSRAQWRMKQDLTEAPLTSSA